MTTLYLSVAPRDLGKFEKMFPGELAKAQRREFHQFGWELKKMLQDRSAKIHWKRRFQRGWRFKTKMYPTTLTVWNIEDHAIFVEKGRRPGATPPPMKAILPWVQDKLGGDEQVAYRVARSIGIKGIAPRPVLTSVDTEHDVDVALSKRLDVIWEKAAKASSLWGRMRGASGAL